MNNYLPKLKRWYARELLVYLKNNPTEIVAWIDFFKWNWKPFLWSYPVARLSELKEMWLVEITWKRKNTIKNYDNINEYRITENWIKYHLSNTDDNT